MGRISLIFVIALPLLAQSTPPVSAPGAASAQPGSAFYGVGIIGSATTQPKPSGFLVVATEISQSAQIWSFSETDAILVANHKIQTSARTGLATPMRKFGAAQLFLLGDAGVASTGTNTGGAFAGGRDPHNSVQEQVRRLPRLPLPAYLDRRQPAYNRGRDRNQGEAVKEIHPGGEAVGIREQ